jgi:phosphate:Na+ symporter
MYWNLLSALGGVGLFLLGMILLTDGLKAVAGPRLRSMLARFTSTPLSGAVTGALTTAAIQSSSATTVAAVGFVASGLLTFPQAIGIIFGANIGTTVTGWLVALLGFKLDLGQITLPLVFAGALLTLSGKKNVASIGQALAGFSLLFIGIEHMKLGLEAFEGIVTPADFPSDSLWGRLELVAIGVLITLITQSSSAGVATALAALSAGAVNFSQAGALVIGMDVGTTFTAALATLGGGTMAKRTGFAHVIYNIMTGVMAFILLGYFAAGVVYWTGTDGSLTALVAFHSLFNILGVILILPFARPFARFIEFVIPDRGDELTKSLDPVTLRDPEAAISAAKAAVGRLVIAVTLHLRSIIGAPAGSGGPTYGQDSLKSALAQTRAYLDEVVIPDKSSGQMAALKGMFHILDHLDRVLYRCGQSNRIGELSRDWRLRRLTGVLILATRRVSAVDSPEACEEVLNRVRRMMRRQRRSQRDRLISQAAQDFLSNETASTRLDALRWLHRVAYHLWRIRFHLNLLEAPGSGMAPPASPADEARTDVEQG